MEQNEKRQLLADLLSALGIAEQQIIPGIPYTPKHDLLVDAQLKDVCEYYKSNPIAATRFIGVELCQKLQSYMVEDQVFPDPVFRVSGYHPESWNPIKPGDHLKVCVSGEHFWTKVQEVNGSTITATVANDLALRFIHGLSPNQELTFQKENIFDTFKEKEDGKEKFDPRQN